MSREPERQSKPWPSLRSDDEAERFVAEADLSEYDWSQARPANLIFEDEATVLITLPTTDIELVERAAKARGVPVALFVRDMVRGAVQGMLESDGSDRSTPAEAAE